MNTARAAAALGAVLMAAALVYGFGWGDGWNEVRQLVAFPWFNVSLVDVYVGFAIVGGWVIHRESAGRAAVWIVLILLLGNLVSCLYVLWALHTAGGDAERFWHGRRVTSPS